MNSDIGKIEDSSSLTRLDWFLLILLVGAVVGVSIWYLAPNPKEFSMDDTYIHFVYARNLVDHGELIFNSPGETGVGTTSLLWVMLLSLAYAFGIPMHITAKVLGISSLILVGIGLFRLLRVKVPPGWAFVCSLAVVLSGNMLWFALSGMETVLFLALGVLALCLYRGRQWTWLGLVLGLLALTRPEGILLGGIFIIIEIIQSKRVHKGIIQAGVVYTGISALWFGYLYFRTGHLLPTSGVGKILSITFAMQVVCEQIQSLSSICQNPVLSYLGLWISYLVEFALGGMALPGPNLSLGRLIGNEDYTTSIWAAIAFFSVVAPLLWKSIRRIAPIREWRKWGADDKVRPFLILIVWCIIHNITYIIFLPSPGTASRYGALNYILLWLGLLLPLYKLIQVKWFRIYSALLLMIIAAANTIYWNDVYDANLDHMLNVRIKAAQYVKDTTQPDAILAVSDIGAMRYFGQRTILDLGGLIDPDLGPVYFGGDLDQYIADSGAAYLVIPGRTGTKEDGWLDFLHLMGIADSPLFDLHPAAIFEIDHQRWLQGYLPTKNYQATVTIYEISYP